MAVQNLVIATKENVREVKQTRAEDEHSRAAERCRLLVRERVGGYGPDEVCGGLDVLSECTLVGECGAVYKARDVCADCGA